MARLTDFSDSEQQHHLQKIRELPDFGETPFVPGPPLRERRVAIVTTSGVHARGDRPFEIGATDYRIIPGDTPAADLIMSHSSVNFDRSGFQEDVNVVFPLDRLRELEAGGGIGAISGFHYSFMGAAPIRALEPKARELAILLKKDHVDAVLLTPV
ncbi:MAG TPA: glycine/sarcosine/betaine reductase selenoprotein B family protein [Burkholderiales bacterium]|nr:glycine/sarcosine/betaine reductase selenoprotein B family protein [Burkholderiales bacterium]